MISTSNTIICTKEGIYSYAIINDTSHVTIFKVIYVKLVGFCVNIHQQKQPLCDKHDTIIYTRGPLAYGYCHCLCLCVCGCLSVCQLLLVRAITNHTYQLESPDLDKKMQNVLLKVPIVLGADWVWLSRSNLASFYNHVYLHRFCVFEICVRRTKTEFVELFHIPNESTHMLITIYAHQQSRAMDREAVYFYIFVRPSQFCQPSTRRLVVDCTSCWRLSPNYRHLTYYDFKLQSPKQLENSVHLPVFCSTSAGFGRGFVSASAIGKHTRLCTRHT